jgi:hypothetical protein
LSHRDVTMRRMDPHSHFYTEKLFRICIFASVLYKSTPSRCLNRKVTILNKFSYLSHLTCMSTLKQYFPTSGTLSLMGIDCRLSGVWALENKSSTTEECNTKTCMVVNSTSLGEEKLCFYCGGAPVVCENVRMKRKSQNVENAWDRRYPRIWSKRLWLWLISTITDLLNIMLCLVYIPCLVLTLVSRDRD